jgi:predicted nucleotidyltransferase
MVKNKKMRDIILHIVDKIKQGCHPQKIVLFGSYSQGNPNVDSDIDLLIVKDSSYRRDERDREIREFLDDVKFPLDIFVYTPEEIKEFRHLKGSFINEIFSKGEVLYG